MVVATQIDYRESHGNKIASLVAERHIEGSAVCWVSLGEFTDMVAFGGAQKDKCASLRQLRATCFMNGANHASKSGGCDYQTACRICWTQLGSARCYGGAGSLSKRSYYP